MQTTYLRIARPEEEHGASTPEEYLRLFFQHRAQQRRRRPSPHLRWPEPRRVTEGAPIVRQGRWLIACACGNYPSYDPAWQLAICFDCAAVYCVRPPAGWAEIEACLMRRSDARNRNVEINETLDDLRRENDAHGLGEGA